MIAVFSVPLKEFYMLPVPPALVEIPLLFHSVELGSPFTKCQICSESLFDSEQPYLIEKVFRGTEAIIEIATCLPCSIQVQGNLSNDSAQTLQREFHDKINWGERVSWLDAPAPIDPDRWIDHCVITGAKRSKTLNFQVGGMFLGNRMAISALPYLISARAVE